MDSDEYVETSDVDEREELERLRGNFTAYESIRALDDGHRRPRKRVKLFHNVDSTTRAPVHVDDAPQTSQTSAITHNLRTSPTQVPSSSPKSQQNLRSSRKLTTDQDMDAEEHSRGSFELHDHCDIHMTPSNWHAGGPLSSPVFLTRSPLGPRLQASPPSERSLELPPAYGAGESTSIDQIFSDDEPDATETDLIPPSPTTDIRQTLSPLRDIDMSSRASPPPPSEPLLSPAGQVRVQDPIPEDIVLLQEEGRSLRARRPEQIRPYQLDHLRYKHSMRRIPEAFVGPKQITSQRCARDEQYEDEDAEDSQIAARNYVPGGDSDGESDGRVEKSRRRVSRALSSEVDDEHEGTARREWRENKEKRKELLELERARKEKEAKRLAKQQTQPTAESSKSIKTTSSPVPGRCKSEPVHEGDNDVSDQEGSITSLGVRSHSDHATSDHSDRGEEDEASDVSEARLLGKMYPPGLVKTLLETARKTQKKRPKRRKPSANLDEEGEDGALKPGQTKVRRVAHAVVKEIKGDSESSDDDTSEARQQASSRSSSPTAQPNRQSHTRSPSPYGYDSDQHDVDRDRRRRLKSQRRAHSVKRERAPVYDLSEQSDMEEITPEVVREFLDDAANQEGPRYERSLIDYMLSRTRVLVEPGSRLKKRQKGKTVRRAQGQEIYRFDVVTSGASGKGRQQRLAEFDGYSRNGTGGGSSSHRQKGKPRRSEVATIPTYSDEERNGYQVDSEGDDQDQPNSDTRAMSQKERKRLKKQRIKQNGLYIVVNKGKALLRSKPVYSHHVTVDLEDNDEQYVSRGGDAHAQIRPWAGPPAHRLPRPPPPPQSAANLKLAEELFDGDSDIEIIAGPHKEIVDENDTAQGEQIEEDGELLVLKDGGIDLLPSGLSFPPTSYLGRGWLNDVVFIISGAPSPITLTPITFSGFEVCDLSQGPLDSARLSEAIEHACESFFDFATKIPDPDQERDFARWELVMHHVCQATTLHMTTVKSVGAADGTSFVQAVEVHLSRLLLRVKALDLPRKAVDASILCLHWFAVELAVRLGLPVKMNGRAEFVESPLADALASLVHHLLKVDVDTGKFVQLLQAPSDPPDSMDINVYTAGVWVNLIHTLSKFTEGARVTNPKYPHLFWKFVQQGILSAAGKTRAGARFDERCWNTIFIINALSQFTANSGTTTATSSLPASWDIIKFLLERALKRIGPTDSEAEERYLRYILSRCLILHERWQWRIAEVSPLVKAAVDTVFAPRKFANLSKEKPEFPSFLRDAANVLVVSEGVHSVEEFGEKDTAYTLLLKFVVKAAKDAGTVTGKGLPAGIRKLVSLAEPVSVMSFANGAHHPTMHELSILINRFTAVATASYLDPSLLESKVSQLRSAFDFAKVDWQTRLTLIRGVYYLTVFTFNSRRTQDLRCLAAWIGELAKGVHGILVECTQANLSLTDVKYQRATLSSGLLFQVVAKVYRLQARARCYPEVLFLTELKELIFGIQRVTQADTPIHKLLENFVDARFAAYPPDQPLLLPAHPLEEEEEESQDYDAMFDEIPLELLTDESHSKPFEKEDMAARKALAEFALISATAGRLFWAARRTLKSRLEGGFEQIEHLHSIYRDALCWIGCQLIGMGNGDEAWQVAFQTMEGMLPSHITNDAAKKRKTRMVFWLASLERYPRCFTIPSFKSDLTMSFFYALVTPATRAFPPTLDAKFVAAFVSIDQLQHPLLRGCTRFPPPDEDTKIYRLKESKFSEIRLGVIDCIFENLESMLTDGATDAGLHMTVVKEMLSAMRSNSMSSEGRIERYKIFCRDVISRLKRHERVSEHEGFRFWVTWTI